MRRTRIALLGSTGSIGRSTLDVIAALPDRFELVILAAATSVTTLCNQARRFHPRQLVVTDPAACHQARAQLGPGYEISAGTDALTEAVATKAVDTVVMAMSGTVGLEPTLAALRLGKRVAIATKEILVAYGEPVMRTARRYGGKLLPIDSELSALHQCIDGRPMTQVRRLILTASGGPFRRTGPPPDATVRQVLRHPTWSMGRKITVDSATLMNKGLEVIETVRLFGIEPERVETVVHAQSIVHSLVEFWDGSVLAQLSEPDMRLPIQYALTYPDRQPSPVKPLRLADISRLDFETTDTRRFPCLALAYESLRSGPAGPCVLNAANQAAVEAFLAGRIAFAAIPAIIKTVLRRSRVRLGSRSASVGTLRRAETWADQLARSLACGRQLPSRKVTS